MYQICGVPEPMTLRSNILQFYSVMNKILLFDGLEVILIPAGTLNDRFDHNLRSPTNRLQSNEGKGFVQLKFDSWSTP